MIKYTLYTGTNCPKCLEVKTFLKNKGVLFIEINVREDEEALAFLKKQGFISIPQLFIEKIHIADAHNYKEKF